jgi:hypothetical protein
MVGGPERHWPTLCVEDRCGTGETRPVRPVEPHLLERVFASFPASTAVLDRDGTIIAVNDRWLRVRTVQLSLSCPRGDRGWSQLLGCLPSSGG